MREVPLSLPEKKFILQAVAENKRLDGRGPEDFRKFDIHFGRNWGSCFVTLGETKVLASVSCEVQEPQATRPNDGLLYINVEVSTMAAPHLEGGTRSDLGVHLNRMLEKCLKESKAVDLESLCIVADEKVWALRVDVNVVNHEGNLLDSCSLAALAALAHFKRPDVTTDGLSVTIHDPAERDPIPITLHHYPVCISFLYISEGNKVLIDGTALEERVADAALVYGVNGYRELCALHLAGSAVLPPRVILRCAGQAAVRANDLISLVKERLAEDLKDREAGRPIGFSSCCELEKITSLSQDRVKIQLGKFRLSQPLKFEEEERKMNFDDEPSAAPVEKVETDMTEVEVQVVAVGDNTGELKVSVKDSKKKQSIFKAEPTYGEGGPSQWVVEVDNVPRSDGDEVQVICKSLKTVQNIELSGDSEEEEVHLMDSAQLEAAGRVSQSIPVPRTKHKKRKPKPHRS